MLCFSFFNVTPKKIIFQIYLSVINFAFLKKIIYTEPMKTIYFEENSGGIAAFEQKGTDWIFLKNFSAQENPSQTFDSAKILRSRQNSGFDFWNNIQKSHNPYDWLNISEHGNCREIIFDRRLETLLACLSLPALYDRNFQEGITLIAENGYDFFAVLVYKMNIYGAFEHNLKNTDTALLQKNLEEFRFGWLPNEEVLKQNGKGCVLKNIPAEAEGFRPTFILCEHKEFFPQMGRFITLENTKTAAADMLKDF